MNMPVSIDFDPFQKELAAGLNVKVGGQGKGSDQGATAETMFSQLLGQALGVREKRFVFKADPEVVKGTADVVKDREKTKGDAPWAESFRKLLMTGGVPLEDLWLSSEAISGLKKLLLDQGFSKIKVERFLEGLFNDRRDGIKALELLKKLGGLNEGSSGDLSQLVLGASAVPHVESLLRKFGMDAQETGNILKDSRANGGELDLEILSRRLNAYLEANPEKATDTLDQGTLERQNGLLRRIGMTETSETPKGPITLDTFVQMLKERVAGSKPNALSDTQLKTEIKTLLDHVFVKGQEKDPKQDGMSNSRNKQEFQAIFQQKGQEQATEGKSADLNPRAGKGRFSPWKSAQASKASSESQTLPGVNEGSDTAQALKHLTGERPELGGKFNFKQRMEEKGSDAAQLRAGFVTRATNNTQTARPATESIPMHVVNQVGRRINLALKKGENHIRIQLKPPDLGSIQLEMSMKDNVLKVAMLAENHAVKDMLMSHVSDLKQSLLQQGIELQKVDVEINYDFGQSMANAQKNLTHGRSGNGRSASESQPAELKDNIEDLEPVQTRVRSDYTVLDVFA